MATINLDTKAHEECFDITARVREIVKASGVQNGLCHVMSLHSTAAVVINENADPNISLDLFKALNQMVPSRNDWLHDKLDGNAASHVRAAILGPQETLAVQNGDLVLGTWQTILFLELDGPRTGRRISVTVV